MDKSLANAKNLPESTIKHISKYTALIVEPREHFALKFVLSNVLNNLDSDWSIVILHGNKNSEYLENAIHEITKESVDGNQHERIQKINLGVDNLKQMEYSDLFLNPRFYDYIPTEMFLIFQTDSMIIPRNKHMIYEYMEYDYVGAPWPDTEMLPSSIGNGGFSLRRKSKMLELLSHISADYMKPYQADKDGHYANEDLFFCGRDHKGVEIKKPPYIKATNFSVESVYTTNPFAVHAVWKYGVNSIYLPKDLPEVVPLMNLNLYYELYGNFSES